MVQRLRGVLPRPTRVTVLLLVVALVLVLVLVFALWRPANATRQAAVIAERQVSGELEAASDILADYKANNVLQGDELALRVGEVDRLLPADSSAPPIDIPRELAAARGLQVTAYNFSTRYLPADPQAPYPGLSVASGTMAVVGDSADIVAFFGDLENYPQLITYTTTGIDKSSASIQVWLWASQSATFGS